MHREKGDAMPGNNSKYTADMREQTARMIIETGKSATSFAEETGIDINTVCRWVREYRRKHQLPTYAEAKGIKPQHPILRSRANPTQQGIGERPQEEMPELFGRAVSHAAW
jgi:transposase-like protein